MSQRSTIHVSRPEPDIVLLTLDHPDKSANILSLSVLEELSQHLDALASASDIAGLIITSAKPGIFIAGADLREFVTAFGAPAEVAEQMCQRGQSLFARLSQTPFVTIAAIDGICVGGGAELAMWCDRRILANNDKTQFGFPEVKLGLFPGWGGTARASRIVGLGNAVELITGGESIGAGEAVAMGVAEEAVASELLLTAAIRLVRQEQQTKEYLADRERWSQPIEISDTELAFLGATASAYIRSQTNDQYPAPLAALEVMLEAARVDLQQACRMEAAGMAQLFGSPVNRALVNIFFLTDRNKKDPGVDRPDIPVRDVKRVGVVGAGIMGSGIVAANLKRQLPVVLFDASEPALRKGSTAAIEEAAYDKQKKGPDSQRMMQGAGLLRIGTGDESFRGCDLLIEAVVETAEVKRQVLQRLENIVGDQAIIASNTSTIPITTLATVLKRPERFCGIHFFNPVRRMRLVEVIRGDSTDDATVATAVAYAKRLGKSPIVVRDGPGFLVNRLLFPYMNEALALLEEGVEVKAIERAARSFGMPMGPIELYDMVGLDTALYAGRTMWEAFPDRIRPSPILISMVKAGRLGQKSGRGFFLYGGGRGKASRPQPDPELQPLVAPYIQAKHGGDKLSNEQLQHRLFLPMLLEATRVLQAGLVRDVRDVDLGLIFGLGFPAFRGGLLWWADQVGVDKILEWLKPLESIGERMKPTELLLQMARDGRKFYD